MRYCPDGKCFDYKDIDNLQRFITESGKIRAAASDRELCALPAPAGP